MFTSGTGYSLVPNAHIRRDIRSGANRRGCVSQRKGQNPDNTDSGNKGEPRPQDGRLTKRYARIRYVRRRCLVPIGLFFYQSLRCFLGSHPVYVLCEATIRYFLVHVIVPHQPNKPVAFYL